MARTIGARNKKMPESVTEEAKRLWMVFNDSQKTQEEFADFLNLSQSNLSRKLRGELPVDLGIVKTICTKLGYNPEWMVLGTGPEKKAKGDVKLVTAIGELRAAMEIMLNENKAMKARMAAYEMEHAELRDLIQKLKEKFNGK